MKRPSDLTRSASSTPDSCRFVGENGVGGGADEKTVPGELSGTLSMPVSR
jgi:hypothetical protein